MRLSHRRREKNDDLILRLMVTTVVLWALTSVLTEVVGVNNDTFLVSGAVLMLLEGLLGAALGTPGSE